MDLFITLYSKYNIWYTSTPPPWKQGQPLKVHHLSDNECIIMPRASRKAKESWINIRSKCTYLNICAFPGLLNFKSINSYSTSISANLRKLGVMWWFSRERLCVLIKYSWRHLALNINRKYNLFLWWRQSFQIKFTSDSYFLLLQDSSMWLLLAPFSTLLCVDRNGLQHDPFTENGF